ncbi:signal peptidase I [Rhodococcus sp. NPDC056743]|uniref:signal peptidase I n=1 Tax=Rhodococcus sp. NPDC056743 TaxID=3345934 RepID=UPI003670B112
MTREKNSHRRGRVRDLALTIGACAGVLCIAIAAASLFLGITPLVFRSGSMEPEISTGALAFSRTTPADEIAVGDVVSVINTQGTRITHRVYGIAPQSDGVVLTLKGDANAEPDVETYFATSVDRILFSVDKLGYVVSWLSGPIGVFLGGVLAGILLTIAFRPGGPRPNRPAPPTGESIETANRHAFSSPSDTSSGTTRSSTLAKTVIAGVTLVSVSLGISQTVGTAAAFQDTAAAASTFSVATAPRVPSVTCTTVSLFGLAASATLTWTAPGGGPYTYKVIVRQNSPSAIASTTDNINALTTSVSVGILGLLADGAYTAEIYTKIGSLVSTTFFPVPLTVGTLAGTKCVKEGAQTVPAGFAARLAPADTPAPTSTTTPAPTTTSAGETTPNTSTSATESSPMPTTTTETTTTATTAPTTTTTPPTTTTATTTAPPTTTTAVPVGVPSDSGNYFAATDTDGTGQFLSITDASGTEVFRTGIEPGDTVHWLTGTDELWILESSGPRKVSQVAGLWTSTSPTGELPAEISALVSK